MPPLPAPPPPEVVARDVERALAEDLGTGDVTADLLPDAPATAYVVAREPGVVAGRPWFDACFRRLDPAMAIDWRVAEGEAVGADHYEMHTINLENGEDRFLTDGDGGQYTDRSPAWAPSGRTIAFERRHKRYPAASLWTVDVESGQPKQLFQKLADVVDPVFSPDGKTLVFGSNHDRRGGLDLMSMDVATLKITPLTDLKGDEHSPSFSPDGTTIAYLNTDQRRPSEDRTELHFLKLL